MGTKKDVQDAIGTLHNSLKYAPYNSATHRQLGIAYLKLGDRPRTFDHFAKFSNSTPTIFKLNNISMSSRALNYRQKTRPQGKKPLISFFSTPSRPFSCFPAHASSWVFYLASIAALLPYFSSAGFCPLFSPLSCGGIPG